MYNDLNEIGSNFFKNKRQEEKLVDLTPHYTLTKVSSNNYHLFNAETKSGETLNRAEVLHRVASINGSSKLSTENIKALDSLANFDSVIIPTSALQLKTKASFDTMSVDPWKLVEVNGTKYFVENLIEVKSEDDKPEEVITKTASVHVAPTSYTVVAHTRGITESGLVAKACDCCCTGTEDNRYVNLSFDMNEPNKLSFNINFRGTPEELLAFLQEQVKKMGVYLPNSAFDVYPNGDKSCTGHQVFPQQGVAGQDAVFIIETPESTKISASPSLETLKVYAKAHYTNYVIKDKDLNVVASHLDNKDNRQSFSSMLSDTLMQLHRTAADEENIKLQDPTGKKLELNIDQTNPSKSVLTKKDTGEKFQQTGDPNTPFTGSQGEKVKITDNSGQLKKLDELTGLPTDNLKLQIENQDGDIQEYDEEDF